MVKMTEIDKIEQYIELYKKASFIQPLKPFGWQEDYIKKTGVYFLFKDNIVVYVGKSNYSIEQRLLNHRLNKKYDYAKYIEISKTVDLNDAEYVYINLFNPFYNKTFKNKEYFNELKEGYKILKTIVDSNLNN